MRDRTRKLSPAAASRCLSEMFGRRLLAQDLPGNCPEQASALLQIRNARRNSSATLHIVVRPSVPLHSIEAHAALPTRSAQRQLLARSTRAGSKALSEREKRSGLESIH